MITALLAIVLGYAPGPMITDSVTTTARADSIVVTVRCQLSNGDRISGTSGRAVGDTLVLDHETLGAVPLPAAGIVACTTSDSATRDMLSVLGKLASPPAAASAAKQRPIWRQSLAFSYSLVRGNADLDDFSVLAGVTRTGTRTRWSIRWFRRTAERSGERSVGMFTLALRLNHALGDAEIEDVGSGAAGSVVPYAPTSAGVGARRARTTVFHELGYEHDGLTKLDRRVVFNAGLSFLIGSRRNAQTTVDVGAGLLEERFEAASSRITGGGLVRLGSRQRLPGGASLEERITLLPDVAQWSRYRLNADVSVRAPLTRTVSLRLGLSDRFDTSPRPGVKKNDFSLQSGIGFEF